MTNDNLLPGNLPQTLQELLSIGGKGVSNAALASKAAVARISGEEIGATHDLKCDIVLIPVTPCRLSIRIDGSEDQVLRLCPYTMCIFRKGRSYQIDYAQCEKLLAVAVDPDWFEEIAETCGGHDITGAKHPIDTILHPDIPPIVNAMRRHLSYPQSPHERFLMLNVELLVSHFFWHQAAEHYQPPLSIGLSNGRLQKVLHSIEQNIEGRILVSELARAATMSPSQFSRSFKSVLGVSPQTYILERRVHRVQDLLEETSMPLVEVALEAGFSSQAHMTATFAKMFGVTPGEYRKHVGVTEYAA